MRSALAVAFAAFLLAACAAPQPATQRDAPLADPAAAARVALLLHGDYSGPVLDGEGGPVVVEARQQASTGPVRTVILEQHAAGGPARRFRLRIAPASAPSGVAADFAPLDASGDALGSCPLEVTIRDAGFVARTDPSTCRFGEGAAARGLVKEIAHDGSTLVIGDRVVEAGTGRAVGADRVLELLPVRRYGVRAAVRDEPGDAWRVGREAVLASDGRAVSPLDAGDMALGVTLELAPVRSRPDGPMLLRLRVRDAGSGALRAQAWTDPQARRMGLELPGLQVALNADR
ncbi:MAG: hypothetical protein R3323_07110 [Wenzhouxiangellaceae bacterium]|nr:hypothetical protein [Wenzhouxiangellaceae bacterium]